MKTETERLKQSTDSQYVKERMQELDEYIEKLIARFNEQIKLSRKASKIEFALLGIWIVTLFNVNQLKASETIQSIYVSTVRLL